MWEITKIFSKTHKSLSTIFRATCNIILQEIIKFSKNCYEEVQSSFIYPISQIAQETFLENFNKVWHNCEDYDNKESISTNLEQGVLNTCKCSLTGILIKFGLTIFPKL